MTKKQIYFNEFNILMGKTAYLPLVSGLLRAYAQTFPLISESYRFMPFIFYQDQIDRILAQYRNPAVAAFSASMWNEQLCLHVAAQVKRRYPECLIVFGGPQIPHYPKNYFKDYPFIDVAARGEGESVFADILTRFLDSRDFRGIPGIAWRRPETNACIRNHEERPLVQDLDVYPSPYLEGVFDELMMDKRDWNYQAIIETNRGCPFSCSFCFWGQGGLSRKYRFHSLDRIFAEIAWCGKNKIVYVFNADSNFGMHSRDYEIAQALVKTKTKYGYPEKFRSCYGKNTDEKIYQIGRLLHEHKLDKGITLSRQTNNPEALKNVQRHNIKMATYRNLQFMFNHRNIPVYTELILGLPGENMQSWREGIEDILSSGLKNQLFIYPLQVYPNTKLADPAYQGHFNIVTQRIELHEIHGGIRPKDGIPEYEDLVVSTYSLPLEEWKKMMMFSWTTMVLHSLKIAFYIMLYLNRQFRIPFTEFIAYLSEGQFGDQTDTLWHEELQYFHDRIERILKGEGRGNILPEYGDIYWDQEEATFLRISENLDLFYEQLYIIIRNFLTQWGLDFDDAELKEAVLYQRLRISGHYPLEQNEWLFTYNFPEYFDTALTETPSYLRPESQRLIIRTRDFGGDLHQYARETILWGRKSGTILEDVSWTPSEVYEEAMAIA